MGNAEREEDLLNKMWQDWNAFNNQGASLLNKMGRDWNAFNNQVAGFPIPQQPELLSEDRATFREDFMQEELDEFRKANRAGNLDGAVDACIDLLYVTVGALGEMGVLVQPTWDEVQRANMAKVRGGLSKRPGSKGFDAVKPEGWKAPSHADYLTITSEDVQTILAIRRGEAHVVLKSRPEQDRSRPKVLVMGYARHGKDTVCELLRDQYGLRFVSSSQFAAERVVFPALQKMWPNQDVPHYETVQQCFEDRANHRKLWYDLITAHNTPDLSRLGRDIFEDHDVYCGIRNAREFHALRNAGVFDVAIWVDASGRGLPAESKNSCTVEPWMADFILDNSGSLEDLSHNLEALVTRIMKG